MTVTAILVTENLHRVRDLLAECAEPGCGGTPGGAMHMPLSTCPGCSRPEEHHEYRPLGTVDAYPEVPTT